MIYCPNPSCQALNPSTHQFCQNCRTPLPHRYLWAIGCPALRPGQLIAERYQCIEDPIVLDTQPGILPPSLTPIPDRYLTYLRLSPYQLHVPQIYAILPPQSPELPSEILLLEQAAIATPPAVQTAQPLPLLTQQWPLASGLRQLNWLRQIASLWHPLDQEQQSASLLNPQLLHVDQSIVRLRELLLSSSHSPTLKQLGLLWQDWIPTAASELSTALQSICKQLIQGKIQTAEQLVAELDQQLAMWGTQQSRQIQISTLSDQGPTRQRNEDACWPPSGSTEALTLTTSTTAAIAPSPIVIVCDGIGGHEGGNVASNLAIETVQHHLEGLLNPQSDPSPTLNPVILTTELELAVCAANDAISQRNDQEQRQERQRMGTTIVLALARAHELYLAHLGDSRAYRITHQGCRQVTLDDDVAAREVRLGYTLYREAVQHPGAGSLVQALGMASSTYLYPSVQHFILDEDCLFLLCSDGLSDNDLVEAHWQTELLPVLQGQRDLATASQRLVELANTQNGHDNVTVGLVYCQVHDPTANSIETGATAIATAPIQPEPKSATTPPPETSGAKTVQLAPRKGAIKSSRPALWPALLGIVILLGLGSALLYLLFPGLGQRLVRGPEQPLPTPSPSISPSVNPLPGPASESNQPLTAGTLIQIRRSTLEPQPNGQADVLTLRAQPDSAAATPSTPDADPPELSPPTAGRGIVPAGSILKVITTRRESADQPRWVQLQVCSVSADLSIPPGSELDPTASPSPTEPTGFPLPLSVLLQPGESGWIQETQLRPVAQIDPRLDANEVGNCAETSL